MDDFFVEYRLDPLLFGGADVGENARCRQDVVRGARVCRPWLGKVAGMSGPNVGLRQAACGWGVTWVCHSSRWPAALSHPL